MAEPSTINLIEILASHVRWLAFDPEGQRVNLTGANLIGANLIGANLIGANLIGADLRGVNLIGANLSGANLSGANLTDANLTDADLSGVNLAGVNLAGVNLAGADLTDADLAGADLTDADLTDADLSGVNLTGANLSGANLSGANLSGTLGLAIAADAPQRLRAAATAALADGALEMKTCHSCSTAYGIGGWLIDQAGEVGRLLEAAVGSEVAGLMLGGTEAHGHFYDDNEAATEWLRSVVARPEVEA